MSAGMYTFMFAAKEVARKRSILHPRRNTCAIVQQRYRLRMYCNVRQRTRLFGPFVRVCRLVPYCHSLGVPHPSLFPQISHR